MISALSIPEGRSNDSKIAVPELALEEMSGTPFVGHLDAVGVPELMGRETPPNAGFRSCPPKGGACGCRRPRPPTRGAVDDAERWADREMEAQRQATAAGVPRPTHPCRPRGGGRPSRGARAASLGAGRGQARKRKSRMEAQSRPPEHDDEGGQPDIR